MLKSLDVKKRIDFGCIYRGLRCNPASRIPRVNTMQIEKLNPIAARYVDAARLLETLFDEASRPSLRWLRSRQKDRSIPFVRCGRKIFFDPEIVKTSLDSKSTGRTRKGTV